MKTPGEDTVVAHAQPLCERCPELEHELAEREGALRLLEEQSALTHKVIAGANEAMPLARQYIAAVKTWLQDAPHKAGCSMIYGLKHARCTCGRDELLGQKQ